MALQRARDPFIRVKEVLERGFADFYDAFADMDRDQDGKVSLHDFSQTIEQLEGGDELTSDQLDSAFNKIGVDDGGFVVYKDFHKTFMGKARRDGNDAGGISSIVIPRPFEEVLMECKDAKGVQKFIAVPSTMQWNELLQKLRHKYGRPVSFMYEADSFTYTVKDERDLKQCWDTVEEKYLASNPVTSSAHLQAFVIDIDPTKFAASAAHRVMRKSNLAPKRVTLGEPLAGDKTSGESAARRAAQQENFDKKHQWIEEMMQKTGVSQGSEPIHVMRKKWEKLHKECMQYDKRRENVVTVDDFKKALLHVEPSMTPEQVAWFVKDAPKHESGSGEILYERYCMLKKTGIFVKEEGGMNDVAIKISESKIVQGLKERYKSLQAAFKRFDEDKDGFISKTEFRQGIESKVNVKLASKILDEIFRRADRSNSGKVDYASFIEYFRGVPDVVKTDSDGTLDSLNNLELCKILIQTFGGVGEMFEELDSDGNGVLLREEFFDGIRKAGIKISQKRALDLLADFSGEHGNNVDYRKFMRYAAQLNQSDLLGTGVDDVSREEARVRDKIREVFPDAKQAFHSFNKAKDGRLAEHEFFDGIDSVFPAKEALPQAMKNKLMRRADMDGDGYLAYHEFLARYGVRPAMRQALSLEKKISQALLKLFPDSLQRAFDKLDRKQDHKLDKEDFKLGVREVLKLAVPEEEMAALLSKLQLDTDGAAMDFQQFLVRFGLDFKSEGRWEYKKEAAGAEKKVEKEAEEIKLFRKSMQASKWHGRGGIKPVLLKFSVLGSMSGKWGQLKEKCQKFLGARGGTGIPKAALCENMRGSTGVDPNLTEQQWKDFEKAFLAENNNLREGDPLAFIKTGSSEILFEKLCDTLERSKVSLAQLRLKEFTSALREGLGMKALTSEDVQVLSGKLAGKPWWNKASLTVDVDKFQRELVEACLKDDLTLFHVLLVKNAWLDIKRVFDSLNTSSAAAGLPPPKTFLTVQDFKAGLGRLESLGKLSQQEKTAITNRVEADGLFEKEGAHVGQLDYMKSFLLHYIPNEIALHKLVYPNWEDCADKFARFAVGPAPELSYQQFKELCGQFTFARDMTAFQMETLVEILDASGDGRISLYEFKLRYAREEAKIMDAVRGNWKKIDALLSKARKPGAARGLLDRADFQLQLLKAREQRLLGEGEQALSELEVVALVAALDPALVAGGEVKYELWLEKYAGDYLLIHRQFERAHAGYKLAMWEVVVSNFEVLESSRSLALHRMYAHLKKLSAETKCPVCASSGCMWRREFEARDLVTWEELRAVLVRSGVDLHPRLLSKLLDDLDPQMHGLVHWRAFVEGRFPKPAKLEPESRLPAAAAAAAAAAAGTAGSPPAAAESVGSGGLHSYVLSEAGSGPYFFEGRKSYVFRQVLVAVWNPLLVECVGKQQQVANAAREKAVKEQKDLKPAPDGTLSLQHFEECLSKVLSTAQAPAEVTVGRGGYGALGAAAVPAALPQATVLSKEAVAELLARAKKTAEAAFSTADKNVDFFAFCRNYSQGEFSAERNAERHFEQLYLVLQKKELQAADGLVRRSDAASALASPELALSENMVNMLLAAHQKGGGEGGAVAGQEREGEREREIESESAAPAELLVDYTQLCWRFARTSIQRKMSAKCLAIFKKARALDPAHTNTLRNSELLALLRSPAVGLTAVEADLLVRRYGKQFEDAGGEVNYDLILAGKWPDLRCNDKLYAAWRAFEAHWELIAERLMASDALNNGSIHVDDLKKLLLGLGIPGLTDKIAVEQVGQELGPDAKGFLKLRDYMWAMARPRLVDVLPPLAPQLLNAFLARLRDLKVEYLKYSAELAERETANKRPAKSRQELKMLERALQENVLTKAVTEEVVKLLLRTLRTRTPTSPSETDEALPAGRSAQSEPLSTLSEPLSAQSEPLSGLHVRILVDRMDSERELERDASGPAPPGAVTEESMLAVLRECSHEVVLDEDLRLFQNSMLGMIEHALDSTIDRWVNPDMPGQQEAAGKEYTGLVVHAKPQAALAHVGKAPLLRAHLRAFLAVPDAALLPAAMRPSSKIKALAERREKEVYHSSPWRTFWQESARKHRLPHAAAAAHGGGTARSSGGGGWGAGGGGKGAGGGASSLLAGAQEKVRKALFQRFDNIAAAFAALDSSANGVLSMQDFKRGVADLNIGLSAAQVEALLAEAESGGGEFIIYKDFLGRYATPVKNLAEIAEERSRAGVYTRLSLHAEPRDSLNVSAYIEAQESDYPRQLQERQLLDAAPAAAATTHTHAAGAGAGAGAGASSAAVPGSQV